MLDYEIKALAQSEVHDVYKLLHQEVKDPKLLSNIKNHIRHGVAFKMVRDGEMVAVALAKKFPTHYSLSYYLISEQTRKKFASLFFFLHIVNKMRDLPFYVKANKNIKDYERYFEDVGDGVYRFKGLREDEEWAALLKR